MPDPYAAKGWPRTAASERVGQLDGFLARLRQLGASPDEVAAVADTWDDYDEDWTPERKAELLRTTDAELGQMLADVRTEYTVGTTPQEQADAEAAEANYRLQFRQAHERIGGNVQSLLDWVGDDPVKARAVLALEEGPDGAGRKTLIGPLQQLLGQG